MKKTIIMMCAGIFATGVFGNAYAAKEFYGTIESKPSENVGVWMIGGQQVQVTDKTELEDDHGPLAVGTCVEVEHKNGIAKEIESVKTEKCTQKEKSM